MLDAQKCALGHVDSVSIDGLICEISGWAVDNDGRPLEPNAVRAAGHVVGEIAPSRLSRPDVVQAHPIASAECGFRLQFSLFDLDTAAAGPDALLLDGLDGRFELQIPQWPADAVAASLAGAPGIPDEPHMPGQGIARLTELLRDAQGYVEYGTGGSTMLACRLGVARLIGVESDRNWLAAVRRRVKACGTKAGVELLHVDIGPTGDWGFPVSDVGWRHYADYPTAPWLLDGMRESVDLVLIDGRFRVACFLTSLLLARPGTRILFDDYYDRSYYHGVEAYVSVTGRHDRIAEFTVPAEIDREKATLALMRTLSDVR